MTAIARATRRGNAGRVRRRQLHHLRLSPPDARRSTHRRLALLLGLLPLASGLMLGSAVAEGAPRVTRLTAAEATRSGSAVVIARHDDLAPGLAEVRVPSAIGAVRAAGTDRLLAVAPDAASVAIAGQVGLDGTALVVAGADGSQLQVDLPGLIAAAFAQDQSWLAAIDGRGALWRVAATDGAARQIADGPFIGQPVIGSDGSVVTLRVPSVEAPYRSELVRVAPDGTTTTLLSEALVYGAYALADGSLAVVAHRPSGTVLLRLAGDGTSTLADLGADAVNVAVASTAEIVAWERGGDIFVQRLPDGRAQRIGAGTRPRVSPDGEALLLELPSGTQVIQADGDLIATFSSQLAFSACPAECAP